MQSETVLLIDRRVTEKATYEHGKFKGATGTSYARLTSADCESIQDGVNKFINNQITIMNSEHNDELRLTLKHKGKIIFQFINLNNE